MEAISLIIAIGIFCFLLLYFAFQLDKKEHFILIFLLICFFIITLPMIPKATLDFKDTCDFVVNSSTTVGDQTSYTYDYKCEETVHNTSNTFFKISQFLNRLFWAYIIIFILWKFFSDKIMQWYNEVFSR